jgi:hypothetical protein
LIRLFSSSDSSRSTAQMLHDRLEGHGSGRDRNVECRHDRARDEILRRDRAERDDMGTVGVLSCEAARHLERKTGLADAARSSERDETGFLQRTAQRGDLVLSSDEHVQRHGDLSGDASWCPLVEALCQQQGEVVANELTELVGVAEGLVRDVGVLLEPLRGSSLARRYSSSSPETSRSGPTQP